MVASEEPPLYTSIPTKTRGEWNANSSCLRLRIRGNQVERSKLSLRNSDLPLASGPVNYSGRICTLERSTGGEMRIVKGHVQRRGAAAAALNVDVACDVVTNAQHVRRFIKDESRSGRWQNLVSRAAAARSRSPTRARNRAAARRSIPDRRSSRSPSLCRS